jgi:hypothetical protein
MRLFMRKRRYGRTELIKREYGTGSILDGYIYIQKDGKKKMAHVLVAEKALGKPLPKGAVVHHVDLDKANNDPKNLVVCPSQAYHLLLHKRMRDAARCAQETSYRISQER